MIRNRIIVFAYSRISYSKLYVKWDIKFMGSYMFFHNKLKYEIILSSPTKILLIYEITNCKIKLHHPKLRREMIEFYKAENCSWLLIQKLLNIVDFDFRSCWHHIVWIWFRFFFAITVNEWHIWRNFNFRYKVNK